MAVALAEAHDLVLDRGAVTRAAARYLAGIHWGTVDILLDDTVGCCGGAGQSAFHLSVRKGLRERGERLRRVVSGLHLGCGPIDGAPVKPWRRARLEAAKGKSQPLQR